MTPPVLLDNPRHHRAVKARAVRDGIHELATEADQALRAHRIAKAIKLATSPDLPPLPPHVIDALRDLLPAGGAR